MELLGALGLSMILASLAQIGFSQAQECPITSISSPDASSLLVTWNRFEGATNYFLDLRVINITNVAPVVVTVRDPRTETTVHGLWPGASYTVTLKVFQFYNKLCQMTRTAATVPATAQITFSQAASSTSLRLGWTNITTADHYFLLVVSKESGERYNTTVVGLWAVVENLRPAMAYDCSVYSVNAAGIGSSSRVRTVSTLVQPPGAITVVQTGSRTARINWDKVEGVLMYHVSVQDVTSGARSSNAYSTNVSTTTVEVDDILPCSSYEISVSSFNTFLEHGEPNTYVYTTNRLNPVTSITVDYTCSDNTAVVSWAEVFGADSYRAEAEGKNGSRLMCTAAGTTSCQLEGVPCGQSYRVYVIAISDNCESALNINASAHFHSAPCPPGDLSLFRECSSNAIIFSWGANNYTDYYRVRAESPGHADIPCVTTDTSCFFTNTMCGRHYTFTVYAVSGTCRSQESTTVSIRTAPCQPKNLLCSADCNTDVLTSTWDVAEGATSYSVEAFGNHNHSARYNCSSATNSCAMPGVACGESLTTYITAFDDDCPSERTLGEVAETVPCVPENVVAEMKCGTDSVTLQWDFAGGAIFYMAMVMDSSGTMHACNSMGRTCEIKNLACSTSYEAYVIASNGKCNSSRSDVVSVETAPCPPSHIATELDCAAATVTVSWAAQAQVTSYTASLMDQSGALLSCSSINQNYCRVTDVRCGEVYEVTVTHHDGICPSMPSRPLLIDSLPCGPMNVSAEVDCGSGMLSVNWSPTEGAEMYMLAIVPAQGDTIQVNTTDNHVSLAMLSCGVSYTVEVRSYNGSCISAPSFSRLVREVPCVPTGLVVERHCEDGSARVTWEASRGAMRYRVVAVGRRGGMSSECSSENTTCHLTDLHCGEDYEVTVMAVDDMCSSMPSESVILMTTPCPPTDVVAQLSCNEDTATLTWGASHNAVSYTGTAVGEDGHTVTCQSATPSCQLGTLLCGQVYNFTVTASDGTCSSPSGYPYTLETAPCAPVGVTASVDCDTDVLEVSWMEEDDGSLQYQVEVTDGGAVVGSCSTDGSNCTVDGLGCGHMYSVAVTASNGECTGPPNAPVMVNTAPCVPEEVQMELDCSTNDIEASWSPSAGAMSYTAYLYNGDDSSETCTNTATHCTFSGASLVCAHTYTLRVMAHNRACNSSLSQSVNITTAPCEPDNIAVTLHCPEGEATVSWSASMGATEYTALAHCDGMPSADLCRTTGLSCNLTNLPCGSACNISVIPGDATCNASTTSYTTIQTTPCAPMMNDAVLNCSTNDVYMSWSPSNDALNGVKVTAVTQQGDTASCETPNNVQSCDLMGLLCGSTYAITGVARGDDDCDSQPSPAQHVTTAPCTPANVEADYTCGTSIAVLSWDDSAGAESFCTRVRSEDHEDGCDTTETHCSLTSLRCGTLYNVTVDALASHCNSSQATAQLETAPCAPANVSASLVCADRSANVTWSSSPGAAGYNVSARARDGDSRACHSTGNSCDLSGMHCHQTYLISVTPYSDTCRGFTSIDYTFVAGPCPPTDVTVSLQCEGNIGTVSWTPALAADLYVATATADDGHTHTCNSTGTSCDFTDLHCGERYTVTVVTHERGCVSEPSQPVTLATGLCPPTNLMGHTACSTNDITLSWDASPVPGVQYILESFPNVSVTTADTRHVLQGQSCGADFAFTVSAKDATCTSGPSMPFNISAVPCPPTDVTLSTTCGTMRGNLTWVAGAGATSYTAIAVVHGQTGISTCTTNETSCQLWLECGQPYMITVISSNQDCNSTTSEILEQNSPPCLPSGLHADMDCSANSLAVQWHTDGDPDTYTAVAMATDGSRLTCTTSASSCTIANLQCGQVYGIAVTTSAIDCQIMDSDYKVQSAPCPAQTPVVTRDCLTNDALVTWDNSRAGAEQEHVVTAVNFYGQRVTCNSSETNCTFSGLGCGEEYSVSVTGYTVNCTAAPSPTTTFHTAPCVPTRTGGTVDCDTGITTVTWDTARGASSYTVYAYSSGHNATCTNTDAHCSFGQSELQCGQDYAVMVEASHDGCVSMVSQPFNISTGPCPHSHLRVALNCSDNVALVSWTGGTGMMYYNATAEGTTLSHLVSTSTTGTNTTIEGLECGHKYRFTVAGQGRTCPSPAREWVARQTACCAPTDMTVLSSCHSDVLTVSWSASRGSLSYMAVAEGSLGYRATCNTSGLTCDIVGLACGQTYTVYVVGVDDNCMGARSNEETVQIAPCTPTAVASELVCDTGLLNITWEQQGEAIGYRTTVTSGDGQVIPCDSEEPGCVVPSLPCGHTYQVTVVAQNSVCNSTSSATHQVVAAPCPPDSMEVEVECMSAVVTVSWAPVVPGVLYVAAAAENCDDDIYFTCNSTGSSCSVSGLTCGAAYNVTVVPVRDTCVGAYYPVHKINTAPCVPLLKEVEMDCLSDSAWVVWEASKGAEYYTATATNSDGEVFTCNSTENQCAVPELPCSRFYNFTVTASDTQCESPPSNRIESETAPCPPQQVETVVNCVSGTVFVEWEASVGAVSYSAALEKTTGDISCCHNTLPQCNFPNLACGEMYVVTITAEGRTCNSSQSMPRIVRTVPCVPQSLVGSVTCSDNMAVFTWSLTDRGHVYQVTAVSTEGHASSCETHEGTCEISDLECGQMYNASVVAKDSTCSSSPSNPVTIRTVPCMAQNVSLAVDCQLNQLSVTWEESMGADSYIANVMDSDGRSTSCQVMTSDPIDPYYPGMESCNITDLACGQIYHVSVTASDGYCDSAPTDTVKTHSVPCMPRNIEAVIDCETNSALVSWQPATGAESYVAVGQSMLGHEVECQTTETNCELMALSCGDSYTITVRAIGDTCSSEAMMPGQLITGPCVTQNVAIDYTTISIGLVSWDSSRGADSYMVEAVTEQGLTATCNGTGTDCVLHDLHCGQTYNVTVTAVNEVCGEQAVSEMVALMTEPCPPRNVQARVECASDSAWVSWEASVFATGYEAILEGRNGHTTTCYTTGTACNAPGLQCGTIYVTFVRATGHHLNSSDSTPVLLTSAPCPVSVSSVAVDVDCEDDSADVSWDFSDGATSYLVEAVSVDAGYRAECMSEENHCNLTELECGQTYAVSLTAINDNCQATSGSEVTFQTRPCDPQRVSVDLQCGTHTATLTWEMEESVEYYVASATYSSSVEELNCTTTGSTCAFPNLECGRTYYFTVTAHGSDCGSYASTTVEIDTEPCPAEDVMVQELSCNNDTAMLMWMAARGASFYSVMAIGNLGYVDSFRTNDTELWVELMCGQTYTFSVVSHSDRCISPPSFSPPVTSTPCMPLHIETYIECESKVGAVSWSASDGADFYTAIAIDQEGQQHVCNSNTTSCTWDDLRCGQLYEVQVVANDMMCTSPPSNVTLIHMDPCIPEGLMVEFDCNMRVGTLRWAGSATAEEYVVDAVADDGHHVSLSTLDTWASISEFRCGQDYYLTVSAVGRNCTSERSPPTVLVTEPCPATMVSSYMDCMSNIAVVSWAPSAGAEYYMAIMKGPEGISDSCLSTEQSCGVSKLLCGEAYTVTVVAANRQCNSTASEEGRLNAVPCVPLNVSVEVLCESSRGEAQVTWTATQGAVKYHAMAQSDYGAPASCESTEPHCTLEGLTCGELYRVHLVSVGDNCTSLPSQAVEFRTVPCVPVITVGTLDCYSQSMLLEWAYARGAELYHGLAQAPNGHTATCSTNYTNCELGPLDCGQAYTYTVTASDQQCTSLPSASLTMDSVPCPPAGVATSLNCDDDTATVTWDASSGADSYMVNAIGWEGHVTGCNTTETQCELPELLCSYNYNVTVTAVSDTCNVSESAITLLHSVPCVPEGDGLTVDLDCETGEVSVSWEPSVGATEYTAVADAGVGYPSECTSMGTTCQFSDLLCGTTYSIKVSASDGTCSSLFSSTITIDTVPCGPQNASAHVDCANGVASVSWQESEGATQYTVEAVAPDGDRLTCQSNTTSCQLGALSCGQVYNVTLRAGDNHCGSATTFLKAQAVPCVPTGMAVALECENMMWERSVAVTWEHASGATGYMVHGTGADGHRVNCSTGLGVTHCELEELRCGQQYQVSVCSVDQQCSSVDNANSVIETAPCPPQDVTVTSNCQERSIVVTRTPHLGDNLHVALNAHKGTSKSCLSPSDSCTFTDLPCGHSYTAVVTAFKDGCKSAESQEFEVSTAPCVPYQFHGSLDCVTNSVWVGYDEALGATSYTALAIRQGGGANSSCMSNELSCNVADLGCGVSYDFSLTASNAHCSTPSNTTFTIETAPCGLDQIKTTSECHSSSILVEWEMSEGKTLYVATAEAKHDRSLLMCNSTDTSCSLTDAQCGTEYTIIISTESDKCSSLRSPPKKMHTAPCAPTNVRTEEVCEHNGVRVTWDASYVANSYMVTATGPDGDISTCNSTVNNCTISDLICGTAYVITVTATGDNCTSPPSAPVTFHSVPCDPEDVRVEVDCNSHSAKVLWQASAGAVQYMACAETADGNRLYCSTTDTHCTIDNLLCGSIYNFSVQATDGVCNSSLSPPEEQGVAPCPPATVSVRVRRVDDMDLVMVSWSAVRDCPGVEYLMTMTGNIEDDPDQGIAITSYWLENTFFEMPLPCGTAFNVTVEARNAAGTSPPSVLVPGMTVPCTPTGFRAVGNNVSAVLEWDTSALTTEYTVYQGPPQGELVLCNTPTLTCTVANVPLEELHLTASNAVGESPATTLSSGSRRRRDLRETHMMASLLEDDMLATPQPQVTVVTGGWLQLEWPSVQGASYYTLIVREDGTSRPPREVLTVYEEVATVTELKAATRYCLTLSAKNSIAQSAYSAPVCVTTGVTQ